uniref:Putative secreted protein n=1 Tax=Anopheles marajoara TaxID=58244 RepID=A0A2M4C627_9DIPT
MFSYLSIFSHCIIHSLSPFTTAVLSSISFSQSTHFPPNSPKFCLTHSVSHARLCAKFIFQEGSIDIIYQRLIPRICLQHKLRPLLLTTPNHRPPPTHHHQPHRKCNGCALKLNNHHPRFHNTSNANAHPQNRTQKRPQKPGRQIHVQKRRRTKRQART